MGTDLPATTIVEFIVGDFEAAWGALAGDPDSGNRGNFMFGLQAVILLEVASRLCQSDAKGTAIDAFSAALASRDRRYFTALPSACFEGSKEFRLPHVGPNPPNQLLAVLFDLIRNGQAHQYQQIRVRLSDDIDFQVSLTGAEHGMFLDRVLAAGRPADHLRQSRDENRDLWLRVRTDILYLDVRDSIREANLLGRGLTLKHLERPRNSGNQYEFSSTELESALGGSGH